MFTFGPASEEVYLIISVSGGSLTPPSTDDGSLEKKKKYYNIGSILAV